MIRLENVYKYYYSNSSVTCALKKINLELKIGEFVAITGESGSGKTTLLNIISGFDTYEDGEIYFKDQMTSYFDSADWEKYRKDEISFIFQNYNLIDSYTCLQNVAIIYILNGYSYKEAKTKAKEKLALVGLEKETNKKAAKLSGGQKQRLSIARALAKETNIIIADEPTGNLDEENGRKVLEVLKNVSKDKLVIVVSHNIAQIEPFITRKIRLFDGEVVVDEYKEQIDITNETNKKEISEDKISSAINFSFLNIITQPIKSCLILMLVLLCTISSFIFYGNFKMNLDDNKTKELDTSIFINMDDTRLLAKKNDSSVITDDILKQAKIDNVKYVEKYDTITDVNYYRPGDYKDVVDSEITNPMLGIITDYSYYELIDNSHFMRSSCTLTEDMLKEGRLPENDFEMVVYSDDSSILNTKEIVLFHDEKTMGLNVTYKYKVEIVGILKEKTEQVYFSETICKILDLRQYGFNISVRFLQGKTQSRTVVANAIVLDPNLKDNSFSLGDRHKEYLKYEKIVGSNFVFRQNQASTALYEELDFDKNYIMDISASAVGVSKNIFDKIYDYYKERDQFVLYIDDYTKTDQVIDDLFDLDIKSISCFKSSVLGYDINKLIDRYINLGVSVGALILINLIIIIIVISIMKFKRNDYLIFKFNGLTNKLCKKINYIEIFIYGFLSIVILLIRDIFHIIWIVDF